METGGRLAAAEHRGATAEARLTETERRLTETESRLRATESWAHVLRAAGVEPTERSTIAAAGAAEPEEGQTELRPGGPALPAAADTAALPAADSAGPLRAADLPGRADESASSGSPSSPTLDLGSGHARAPSLLRSEADSSPAAWRENRAMHDSALDWEASARLVAAPVAFGFGWTGEQAPPPFPTEAHGENRGTRAMHDALRPGASGERAAGPRGRPDGRPASALDAAAAPFDGTPGRGRAARGPGRGAERPTGSDARPLSPAHLTPRGMRPMERAEPAAGRQLFFGVSRGGRGAPGVDNRPGAAAWHFQGDPAVFSYREAPPATAMRPPTPSWAAVAGRGPLMPAPRNTPPPRS